MVSKLEISTSACTLAFCNSDTCSLKFSMSPSACCCKFRRLATFASKSLIRVFAVLRSAMRASRCAVSVEIKASWSRPSALALARDESKPATWSRKLAAVARSKPRASPRAKICTANPSNWSFFCTTSRFSSSSRVP